MKKYISTLSILGLLLVLSAPAARAQVDFEQSKRAQTVFKFLDGPMNARASAMAGAMATMEGSSTALFFNPAGMAYQESFGDLSVTRTQFIVDINYNAASFSVQPLGGTYGVLGFTVVSVDYGALTETVRADNDDGYLDLGTFSPGALSFGVGWARPLTDRFSIGAHIKYARVDLGSSVESFSGGSPVRVDNAQSVIAYDFGMMYHTGFRGLIFAAQARNFAPEVTFFEENEELPLSLEMGISMDVMQLAPGLSGMHGFMVSVDAESPRDYSERIKLGGEYTFMDILSLRAGYSFPSDEKGISLGAGIQQEISDIGVGIDYAYTDYGALTGANLVHHLGFNLYF